MSCIEAYVCPYSDQRTIVNKLNFFYHNDDLFPNFLTISKFFTSDFNQFSKMDIIPDFYHTIYDENDNENDTNEVNDDDESDNDIRCEKENGIWARKTYKCHHGGKYEPKKNVDPTHNRNQESARIDCGFLVNAACRKRPNLVFINKFVSEHNHALHNVSALQEFSPISRKIPDNIMEEIQFYVQECHLGASVLKRILRNKYPNQDFIIKISIVQYVNLSLTLRLRMMQQHLSNI
ncbi:unnamed protein product [Rhizophagus irregularis]|nr:unnamed protein product [Rhizophagus irregularis]